MSGLRVNQELNKGFVPRDGRSRIIGHLPGVVDVLGFSFCRPAEARWARGTFHKARIAHSGTVLQRVVNPAGRVDLGAALSAKVFGWVCHTVSPNAITLRLQPLTGC